MSEQVRAERSRLQLIWLLLGVFVTSAAIAAIVALFIEVAADSDPGATGWLILAGVTFVVTVVLLALQQRWIFGAPSNLGTAVMTGVLVRLAIAESVFLVAFSLYFTGIMSRNAVVAGLAVAVVLTWLFAAPTGRNTVIIQDQVERAGLPGDVDTALRQSGAR